MKPLDRLTDDEFATAVQRAAALPEPPDAVLRAAIALFPPRPSVASGIVGGIRDFIAAVLSFDSWAQPALAGGMRSGNSAVRHLLFSTDGRDVDLRISPDAGPAPGLFALTGQVLGTDESGFIELASQGEAVAAAPRTVALDAFGEFRLDEVGRGTYELTLRFERDAIRLPPIVVGERPA
jgi:hypothetical protein